MNSITLATNSLKKSKFNRQEEAKNTMQGRGNTVNEQRLNFRKEFLNRLKTIRNENVDRLRQLCEIKQNVEYRSLLDLRKKLQPDDEINRLLSTREVIDLVSLVEAEILESEALAYTRIEQEETESLLRLMNPCQICETLIVEGEICFSCCSQINDELMSDNS